MVLIWLGLYVYIHIPMLLLSDFISIAQECNQASQNLVKWEKESIGNQSYIIKKRGGKGLGQQDNIYLTYISNMERKIIVSCVKFYQTGTQHRINVFSIRNTDINSECV